MVSTVAPAGTEISPGRAPCEASVPSSWICCISASPDEELVVDRVGVRDDEPDGLARRDLQGRQVEVGEVDRDVDRPLAVGGAAAAVTASTIAAAATARVARRRSAAPLHRRPHRRCWIRRRANSATIATPRRATGSSARRRIRRAPGTDGEREPGRDRIRMPVAAGVDREIVRQVAAPGALIFR